MGISRSNSSQIVRNVHWLYEKQNRKLERKWKINSEFRKCNLYFRKHPRVSQATLCTQKVFPAFPKTENLLRSEFEINVFMKIIYFSTLSLMKNRTKTNRTLPHIPLLHNASARSVWFCTKRCDPSMSKSKFRRPVWKKNTCAIKTGELKWSFFGTFWSIWKEWLWVGLANLSR